MKTFNYKIIDKNGNIYENTLESNNIGSATELLENKGYSIISLKEKKSLFKSEVVVNILSKFLSLNVLNKKKRLEFYTDLYSLIKIGMGIEEALVHISKNTIIDPEINTVANLLLNDLEKGIPFHQALRNRSFPNDICEIIKTGMEVGATVKTIKIIMDREILSDKIDKSWSTILSLPKIMIPVIMIATVAVVIYLVPMLKTVLTSMVAEEDLPNTSKMVFALADNFVLVLSVFTSTIVSIYISIKLLYLKSKSFKMGFDKIILKTPIYGKFIYFKEMANFTSLMALTLGAGYKAETVLEKSIEQFGNAVLKLKAKQVYTLVQSGSTISDAMFLVNFDSVIQTTLQRGEYAGRESSVDALEDSNKFFSNKTLENLQVLENSSEFINTLLLYIISSPLLAMVLIPQFDQFKVMITMM